MEKVTRMNCERLQQLWDDYRDGQLAGPDARGLEQHLADCPACEKLWRGESAWLGILGEKTPVSSAAAARAVSTAVPRRWSRWQRPSVIGRISRMTAAAAVIAVIITGAMV